MPLTPLTEEAEVRAAFRTFVATFTTKARKATQVVGHLGYSRPYEVYRRDDLGCWAVFEGDEGADRYWCPFGLLEPSHKGSLDIVCEINIPVSGVNRRVAGLFVRDGRGRVYLAHSGKIGGGRKGVGKTAFWATYRDDDVQLVRYPDGQERQIVVIGPIDGRHLAAQVAQFVRKVDGIKRGAVRPRQGPDGTPAQAPGSAQPGFHPEFSGPRTPYPLGGVVESNCCHGLVVDQLHTMLLRQGAAIHNDRLRDLFITGTRGQICCLFEVKTDLTTTSLYAAIGQLLFHSASEEERPLLVAVLPGEPTPNTVERFQRLGITILPYSLTDEAVQIDLDPLMRELASLRS